MNMNNQALWILVLSITIVSIFFLFAFPLPIQRQKPQAVRQMSHISGLNSKSPTNQTRQNSPAIGSETSSSTRSDGNVSIFDPILAEQKKRQDRLRAKCAEVTRNNLWDKVNTAKFLFKSARKPRLYYSDKHEVVVCGVPKCASTEWRKALLIVEGDVDVKTPQEIGHENSFTLAMNKRFLWKNFPPTRESYSEELDKRLNGYMRIMTVREPLERVVSAYIDKMLPGGTAVLMYQQMSRNIHRRFAKDKGNSDEWATFEEFVDNILAAPGYLDIHWQQYSVICDPCSVHYNYIAKLETIVDDSVYISKNTGIDQSLLFDGTKKPRTDSQEKHSKYEKYLKQLPKEKLKRLFEVYKTQYELFDYPFPDFVQSL